MENILACSLHCHSRILRGSWRHHVERMGVMFHYKKLEQDKLKEYCRTIATQCDKLKLLIQEQDNGLVIVKKKEPNREKLDGNEEVVLNQEAFMKWGKYDVIH